MGAEYYLVREDNSTAFDLGKAHRFAEYWGVWGGSASGDCPHTMYVDARCDPFIRTIRDQCGVWGIDARAALIAIDDMAEDRPLVLMSDYVTNVIMVDGRPAGIEWDGKRLTVVGRLHR